MTDAIEVYYAPNPYHPQIYVWKFRIRIERPTSESGTRVYKIIEGDSQHETEEHAIECAEALLAAMKKGDTGSMGTEK